jgi:hypothetical protein
VDKSGKYSAPDFSGPKQFRSAPFVFCGRNFSPLAILFRTGSGDSVVVLPGCRTIVLLMEDSNLHGFHLIPDIGTLHTRKFCDGCELLAQSVIENILTVYCVKDYMSICQKDWLEESLERQEIKENRNSKLLYLHYVAMFPV